MIDIVIDQLTSMNATIFWIIASISMAGAMVVRELSGRIAYSILGMPVFLAGGLMGYLVFDQAGVQYGVDPVTDAIMAALAGMTMMVVMAVFLKMATNMFTVQD